MNFKSVFITGGAGYVGSSLVPDLLKKNFRVAVYDTMYFGNNFLPKNRHLRAAFPLKYSCFFYKKILVARRAAGAAKRHFVKKSKQKMYLFLNNFL